MLHENVGAVGPIEAHVTPTPLDARVSRAKNLMQQKREEKEQEEEDTEKNKVAYSSVAHKKLKVIYQGWILPLNIT